MNMHVFPKIFSPHQIYYVNITVVRETQTAVSCVAATFFGSSGVHVIPVLTLT